MAVISLREYNREIDSLIDQGKTDDAIQHCKHILKFFPKHVDTYRLLGKSFLESQRFTEAADLFQRVLSVFPDDFISQIGLSIIREDEGNLDAAIWHIERAFEIQPSNAPIRDELRRLYGRRDGVQPPKVRLTRGALIRMYMQGQLYPQAIAEAKAALQEDPKRIDLEILLAKLFYLSGNRVDAINICSNIISKLPFCYEANKILAVILPGTSRSDSAKLFQRRIAAIQPYAAYLTKENPGIEQVPDNTVTLEKLDLEASGRFSSQPEWAQTIGVEIETPVSEQTPEWFTNIEAEEEPESTPTLQEEGEIPDWMKDAGWELRDKDKEEPQPYTGFEEEEEEEEEINLLSEAAPGDLPDWLKELSPEEPEDSLIEAETKEDDKFTSLEELFSKSEAKNAAPSDTVKEISPEKSKEPEEFTFGSPEEIEEIPDWLKGFEDDLETKDEELTEETFNPDMPDWFKDSENKIGNTSEEITEVEISEDFSLHSELPEWSDMDDESPGAGQQTLESEKSAESDISEWLGKLTEAEEQEGKQDSEPILKENNAEEIPEWMKTIEGTPEFTSQEDELYLGEFQDESGEEEDLQDKLAEMPALENIGDEAEDLVTTEDTSLEEEARETQSEDSELESWLASLDIDQFQKKEDKADKEKEIPEWLSKLDMGQREDDNENEETISEDSEQELMEFLSQLENEEKVTMPDEELQKTLPEMESEIESTSELPDWLKNNVGESEQGPEFDHPAALPDWLETADGEEPSLFEDEKPPISESEPKLQAENQAWLETAKEEETLAAEDEIESTSETELEFPAGLPNWFTTTDEEDNLISEDHKETIRGTESELPEWLDSLDEETPLKTEEKQETEADIESELPDWMDKIEEKPSISEDILSDEEVKTTSETDTQEIINRFGLDKTLQQNDEIDEAIAWLESLSGNQGKEELSEEIPEITSIDMPDEESILEDISFEETEIGEEDKIVPSESLETSANETILAESDVEIISEEIKQVVFEETIDEPKPELAIEKDSQSKQEKEELELEDYLEKTPPRQIAQEEMPTDTDIDQALAWLESLAVKQGAEEETLITKPESRLETPPDWVEKSAQQEIEQAEETQETPEKEVSPTSETSLQAEKPEISEEKEEQNTSEWLKQMAEQQDSIQETLRPGSFKRIKFPPDWVKEEPKEAQEIKELKEQETESEKYLVEKVSPHIIEEEPAVPEILEDEQREKELAQFQKQIKSGKDLDNVISALQDALYHAPMDSEFWQILGDAYFKAGNLEESLKAYNKAEELLQ